MTELDEARAAVDPIEDAWQNLVHHLMACIPRTCTDLPQLRAAFERAVRRDTLHRVWDAPDIGGAADMMAAVERTLDELEAEA